MLETTGNVDMAGDRLPWYGIAGRSLGITSFTEYLI